MPTTILGMDAKIYYGSSGSTASNEMSNVKDVTLTCDAGEADITTRANSGWRATRATLKECSVEFEMLYDPDDAGFVAIRDAYLGSDIVALLVLTEEGGEGPDADFAITSFSRSEALEEAVSVKVTAKLSVFRAWQE
jgi:hypothetical protein